MFNVTDRRLAKAKPILEEFLEQINTRHLELKLRACRNKGYRTIKDAMVSPFKSRPRYRKLAAYERLCSCAMTNRHMPPGHYGHEPNRTRLPKSRCFAE